MDEEPSVQYVYSFYWAFQTLTTVGYGSPNASGNFIEMFVSLIWMIFGVGLQSSSIGLIVTIIQQGDKEQEELNEKMEILKVYRRQYNITNNLFYSMMKHFQQN